MILRRSESEPSAGVRMWIVEFEDSIPIPVILDEIVTSHELNRLALIGNDHVFFSSKIVFRQ